MNNTIFENFDESFLEVNKEKIKMYFEYKEINVNNIQELLNIESIYYKLQNTKINSIHNVIDIKNIICNILTNQSYFETKKGLLEVGGREK